MNSCRSSKIYFVTLISAIMLCCFNGSVIDNNSVDDSTDPDNNFYGILEDHFRTANVEFILIGNKYQDISVYQDVTNAMIDKKHQKAATDIDPKQNKILLNLKDVRSIALKHPENLKDSSILVNNKTYIEIIVESITGTKKNFLVEASRRVTCKEIDKSGNKDTPSTLQTRDLNFTHIKKLTIQGYKSSKRDLKTHDVDTIRTPQPKPINFLQQKTQFEAEALQIIKTIEENVKNLPIDNPTAFETMRKTVLLLLQSLQDQLQKFLDMVK